MPYTVYHLLLLVLQQTARGVRAAGVEGFLIFLDVLDNAFLVHHKGDAIGEAVSVVQDPVVFRYDPLEIAQERESESLLFRKNFVGRGAVHADAQHLGVRLLEFGDISLIRLQLLRSTTGEGEDVKRQNNVFLAAKIAQLRDLAVLIGQSKVRCPVTHAQTGGASRHRDAQGQRQDSSSGLHSSAHGSTSSTQ